MSEDMIHNKNSNQQRYDKWQIKCHVANIHDNHIKSNNDDTDTASSGTIIKHSISTGIGFLDHMIDQLYSHAQIFISLQVSHSIDATTINSEDTIDAVTSNGNHSTDNRYASYNQIELLSAVGDALGTAIRESLLRNNEQLCNPSSSTFACPLDEALTKCVICNDHATVSSSSSSSSLSSSGTNVDFLTSYTLSPYGIYPSPSGRTHIGSLQTLAIESFWKTLAMSSHLRISLSKIRGTNAHHIVESSFKAFARALRNLLDGVDTISTGTTLSNKVPPLVLMYGPNSVNYRASIDLQRSSCIVRTTKETSIRTEIYFDDGLEKGIHINTGIHQLDEFFQQMAHAAGISLIVSCTGDMHIDEHHTAEDVAISIGQCLYDALGNKAGLNRMWCASEDNILVVMDVSNRPCFVHNFTSLHNVEKVNDLSCEMFEHVIDSIVINARLTVHVVEQVDLVGEGSATTIEADVRNVMLATARAFGHALKYCCMIDIRRAGSTASSKGTLSV